MCNTSYPTGYSFQTSTTNKRIHLRGTLYNPLFTGNSLAETIYDINNTYSLYDNDYVV